MKSLLTAGSRQDRTLKQHLPKQFHEEETKHLKVRAYGGHSHSNHHNIYIGNPHSLLSSIMLFLIFSTVYCVHWNYTGKIWDPYEQTRPNKKSERKEPTFCVWHFMGPFDQNICANAPIEQKYNLSYLVHVLSPYSFEGFKLYSIFKSQLQNLNVGQCHHMN